MAVSVHQLSKYYGKQKALDEVSFTLHPGEICGFLGPNGAGKSTTMKIITGYLDDYSGEVSVCGINMRHHPLEAKARIGYLPEHNPLYPDMYVPEYLEHVARLYRCSTPAQQVQAMMELTGLLPEKKKKIGQLSKGYRQRVGLAQALIHQPDVLILDEPMTGLDPNQLEDIRDLIIRTGKDKTILLSTHIMQEVEAICDRIIIINQGKVVADQPKTELSHLSGSGKVINIAFATGYDTGWFPPLATSWGKLRPTAPSAWQLVVSADQDPRIEIFKAAAAHQCPIIQLQYEEQNLEEVFRLLTH